MSSSQKEPMIVRWKDNIVEIGAGRPVVIQSMTNTDTADVESSTKQVLELALAGSELVRLTVNTPAAAKAIPEIRRRLDETGCFVPLVGDFHYNGHKLLTEYRECAEALSKYRINPGNVGKGDKQEENFRTMVELAKKYDKPVRIGVNWGSLDQDLLACMMSENQKLEKPLDAKEVLREALVRSAVENADRAVELGMKPSQVAISAKVSGVKDLIAVYRELKARCAYPLHLGLTEAGMGLKGTVSTTAAPLRLLRAAVSAGKQVRAAGCERQCKQYHGKRQRDAFRHFFHENPSVFLPPELSPQARRFPAFQSISQNGSICLFALRSWDEPRSPKQIFAQ